MIRLRTCKKCGIEITGRKDYCKKCSGEERLKFAALLMLCIVMSGVVGIAIMFTVMKLAQ